MKITARVHSNLRKAAQSTLGEMSRAAYRRRKQRPPIVSWACRTGHHGQCVSDRCVCGECKCAANARFLAA